MTSTSLNAKSHDEGRRVDLHQRVTDTIIRQLEAGTVPWLRPWKGVDLRPPGLPLNFTTRKHYRGINILLLWGTAIERQYSSDAWATFKQWQSKNERIRKDEKGTMIVYYDTLEREVEDEMVRIPFLKSSVVFNRCQLASYAAEAEEPAEAEFSLVEKIDAVEAFVENTHATIGHIGTSACYVPSDDIIYMPNPEKFVTTATCTATEGYYSTLLHELTHWSGAEKRLNRAKSKRFGDENYATEELVAELGAAFLCAEFDITTADKGNHAAYIDHWLKVLKADKQCVLTAASHASRAVDYLKGIQPTYDIA